MVVLLIVLHDPMTLLQIKTQRNTNLLSSARVTPNIIFFFSQIIQGNSYLLKGVLKDSTKKTPFNIIAKLFTRVISEVKFSAD